MGMNVVKRNSLKLGRVVVLVIAIVVAAIGIGQDAAPVKGGQGAQIFLSYSNSEPIWAPTLVLYPAGTSLNVYVWVVGVDDPSGVSAYSLDVNFDGSDFTMTSFIGDATWLNSSGRSGACAPAATIEPPPPERANHAYLSCNTIGQAPPFGATGNGLLAKMVLRPADALGNPTTIDFSSTADGGTRLLNTPADPDDCFPIQPTCFIPVTWLNSTVIIVMCADNSGDGVVDLSNDILGVILRYQMSSTDPEWNPGYDLNKDGIIDLSNDILGTILQYGTECLQTL